MVSQTIQTHIILECDGSGNMLWVFSDSVDRLKWVLGGKNWYRSRDINFDTLKSLFSCFLSRHGPERFVLNAWSPPGSKRSRLSHSLYGLNKTTPESRSQYVCKYISDFDPKIENFGIGDPEIENWNLSSRDPSRDLWVVKVYPGLRNHQKLTQKTSKSIPDRQNTIYVIKWEFIVGSGLDGF